jgi:hypothetical protein
MKNHLYPRLLTRIIIIFVLLLSAHSALALTISPPISELSGDPGSTIQGIIKVYNETKDTVTVYASAANFTAKNGSDGEPQFTDINQAVQTKDLASWIKVPTGAITVNPLDWQTIVFQITLPKDAEPGGHYAAVFFSPNNPAQAGNGAVTIDYKTGSLILLSVSGDVKQEGKLKSITLKDDKYFFEHIPVTTELMIENSGNLHFRPGGAVEIKNMLGQKVTDLPILNTDAGGNILPNSSRRYDVTWGGTDSQNLPQGFWNKVKYELSNFHLGKYTAVATVGLPQGMSEPMAVSFWLIPWQLIIVVILGLAILWFIFRTYNRWIIKKARGGK